MKLRPRTLFSVIAAIGTIILTQGTFAATAGLPCEAQDFTIIDEFSSARRGSCTALVDNHVSIEIIPENSEPINDSAWYAFKLVPKAPVVARILINYTGGHHRYWPKISQDGLNWLPLDERYVHAHAGGRKVELQVPLADKPVWIAAQELITLSTYQHWSKRLERESGANLSILGESKGGFPIHVLDSGESSQDVILIIGRQHPPEVTGAIAFFTFVETLFGSTDLAQQFRKHYRLLTIPVLNPDGVHYGHWRHNLGGVDLNRDWGPFTQPETRLVKAFLDRLEGEGKQIRLFLDFHSTQNNLLYTQSDQETTIPANFAANWFSRVRPRLQDYSFRHEPRALSDKATGKNYMYRRYGIPSITYEVGDKTEATATQVAAQVFAEEMMVLMLDASGFEVQKGQ